MSSSKKLITCLSIILVVVLLCTQSVHSQLQVGFYMNSCMLAEFIVKDEVRKAFIKDKGVAAGLVRLHFHDCFVRGCEASVLIDSTASSTAEKDSPANNPSLRGFEVIDNAKAKLEAICKGVVSCADIVAFAARDSIELTGGVRYYVPAGRRDGRISLASETLTNLPPPTLNVDQLTQSFANKGFTQEEMVTLSARLKEQCPQGSTDPNLVVPMNPSSPAVTDVGYYIDILANRGLFTSDQTLLRSPETANQVNQNARNPMLWRFKFAAAMLKMGQLGVLTGNAGEIRTNCRVINS
ncbi:peroxidase 5-like isoform X1 [Juglans regia]|uniref:Peroxidase n=1 Tax=Juglans regia TaxID=51240 RepID=A0A6P9EDY9_JUGRE|nr:peroxidase 5-like isoform X1 [Juglans regia]